MEEYLKDTYGMTVYQRQVMLLSQNCRVQKGDAGYLRSMGKKQNQLDKMKAQFISGGNANALNQRYWKKIWTDWRSLHQYAFNNPILPFMRCGLQTDYLKRPTIQAKYMAAV